MSVPPTTGWLVRPPSALTVVRFLAVLLIIETAIAVFVSYGDYFPPNFRSHFLLGRRSYFHGAYSVAFYVHILTGPMTLLVGLVLLSNRFRLRWPMWHRRLGRLQVLAVLLLLAPSGLWMAWYAATGTVAATGFAALAIATAATAAMGWRAAVGRRFDDHRRWMQRCYLLLCSAVVLRVMGGGAEVLGVEGTYSCAAWLCWLLPLVAFELGVGGRGPILPALHPRRSLACRVASRDRSENR